MRGRYIGTAIFVYKPQIRNPLKDTHIFFEKSKKLGIIETRMRVIKCGSCFY